MYSCRETRFWIAFGRNVGAAKIMMQASGVGHCSRRGDRTAFHEDRFVRVEPVLHGCGSCGSEEVP
jgi:hypothetical protein